MIQLRKVFLGWVIGFLQRLGVFPTDWILICVLGWGRFSIVPFCCQLALWVFVASYQPIYHTPLFTRQLFLRLPRFFQEDALLFFLSFGECFSSFEPFPFSMVVWKCWLGVRPPLSHLVLGPLFSRHPYVFFLFFRQYGLTSENGIAGAPLFTTIERGRSLAFLASRAYLNSRLFSFISPCLFCGAYSFQIFAPVLFGVEYSHFVIVSPFFASFLCVCEHSASPVVQSTSTSPAWLWTVAVSALICLFGPEFLCLFFFYALLNFSPFSHH